MSNLSPTDLMLQARDTATQYFNQAVRIIDEKFGEGYAEAHPELIVGFMRTASADFHTAVLHFGLESIADSIGNQGSAIIDSNDISQICDSMDRSSGDVLEGFTRIAKAIEEMTGAIERGKRNE
jgi:hypothetical protein